MLLCLNIFAHLRSLCSMPRECKVYNPLRICPAASHIYCSGMRLYDLVWDWICFWTSPESVSYDKKYLRITLPRIRRWGISRRRLTCRRRCSVIRLKPRCVLHSGSFTSLSALTWTVLPFSARKSRHRPLCVLCTHWSTCPRPVSTMEWTNGLMTLLDESFDVIMFEYLNSLQGYRICKVYNCTIINYILICNK